MFCFPWAEQPIAARAQRIGEFLQNDRFCLIDVQCLNERAEIRVLPRLEKLDNIVCVYNCTRV